MQLNTRHFGEIEVEESSILNFEDGIPGFENVKKYVVFDNGDQAGPFKWLQGVDNPELAFAVVDPFSVKTDYDINISDETVRRLDIKKVEEVKVYSIVVVPEDVSKISMNLKAPIILNTKNNKGAQVVLDTDKYGVRHYILDELKEREVKQDACSDKEEGPVHSNK